MPLTLDHIVIAVADLPTAIQDFSTLGFQVLPGGEHPGRTSHNALVVFEDGAYLELIAWRAPAEQERWYRTLRAQGEGLVDFALLPNDTAQALAQARARGLDTLTGPLDGGRLRPDGERLQWQTARHATPDLPFLCGDITPRALRVPEGDVRIHPNGAVGVAQVTVAVRDLPTTLVRYQALMGGEGNPTPLVVAAGGVLIARVRLCTTELLLQSPDPGAAPASDAACLLQARLDSRGEGPCAMVLRYGGAVPPRAADLARTHGVALSWQISPDAV